MPASRGCTQTGLSVSSCRRRQERLQQHLLDQQLDAALLTDRRNVHYLTGHWYSGRPVSSVGVLFKANGDSVLAVPQKPRQDVAATKVECVEADRLGTLVDNQHAQLIQALQPYMQGLKRIGCDEARCPWLLDEWEICDLNDAIQSLRRTKDEDEVAMLGEALRGCEAAYARAKEMLAPGVTEVELYAQMQAAAVEAVGEPLTEFGNDFQCGALGSLPRNRPVEAGDTAILDVSVVLRGYSSDICRTFVIGAPPTEAQLEAHRLVTEALDYVETTVRPGVSCKELYEEVHEMLHGHRGWTFSHHLGHGIGLSAHEAPRLNPNWDDTFEVGDVFTAEPGLYGDELHAGVRVEQNYVVTGAGVERLSHFPVGLAVCQV